MAGKEIFDTFGKELFEGDSVEVCGAKGTIQTINNKTHVTFTNGEMIVSFPLDSYKEVKKIIK